MARRDEEAGAKDKDGKYTILTHEQAEIVVRYFKALEGSTHELSKQLVDRSHEIRALKKILINKGCMTEEEFTYELEDARIGWEVEKAVDPEFQRLEEQMRKLAERWKAEPKEDE